MWGAPCTPPDRSEIVLKFEAEVLENLTKFVRNLAEIRRSLLKFGHSLRKCSEVEWKSGGNVYIAGRTNGGDWRKLAEVSFKTDLLCRHTHSYYAPMRQQTPKEMKHL